MVPERANHQKPHQVRASQYTKTAKSKSAPAKTSPMNPRTIIDWRVPASQAWKKSEHDLQSAIVTRTLGMAGAFPEILMLHAIPNGDFRGWGVGKKLKAEGVIPGVPDICLPVARAGFHGFYMELKKSGGHVREDQWEFMEALHAQGYFVRLTNHLPTALEIIENYLREMP